MAVINKTIGKHGWAIQIRDFGLNTTLRTTITSKVEINVKLREIKTRIDKLKNDKSHEFWAWTKDEKREFVKHGNVPVVEEEVEEPLKLVKALEEWIGRLRLDGKSVGTINSYKRYIGRAIAFFGDRALESFTTKEVQSFIDDYKSTPIASGQHIGDMPQPVSQQKHIDHLVMLWNHHVKFGVPNLNPLIFKPIQVGKQKAKKLDDLRKWDCFERRTKQLKKLNISVDETDAYKEVVFTKPQLNELREYLKKSLWDSPESELKHKQLFAALMLCMFTGLRRSEIPRVRKKDVDIEYEEITLLRMKGRKNKEFNRKTVAVHPIAMDFIKQLIEMIPNDQRSVFCDNDNHLAGESFDEIKNMSKADCLSKDYRKALQSTKWKNACGFHKYRHSLASVLYAEGMSRDQVKDQVGWADDAMFERYKHIDISKERLIILNAFPMNEFQEIAQ